MRILVDENIDVRVVRGLKEAGHDVLSVREAMPGTDDSTVLQTVVSQQRIILTHDRDFVALHRSSGSHHNGIVLLRLDQESHTKILLRTLHALSSTSPEKYAGHIVVVSEAGIRYHPK